MEKKTTVQRKRTKKKSRPKLRFRFGMLIAIFFFSFLACFVLYMLAANLNDNFFQSGSDIQVSQSKIEDENTGFSDFLSGSSENSADIGNAFVNPVTQSEAADETYFNSCCLITDSILMGMKESGKFSENNVFGNSQLTASGCMTTRLESSFGTLTANEIIKKKKPEILYIMLGSDLETSSADDMLTGYANMVNGLHSLFPDMKIYVMQIPPALYDSDTLTNEMINDYNNRLLTMCNTIGVYCIDTNTALKAEDGRLDDKYWSYETLSISSSGFDKIAEYILNHIV